MATKKPAPRVEKAAHRPKRPAREIVNDPLAAFDGMRAELEATGIKIRASDWLEELDRDDIGG